MRVPSFALICCCCCTHALLEARKFVGDDILKGQKEPLANLIENREGHIFPGAVAIEPCEDDECLYESLESGQALKKAIQPRNADDDDENDGDTDWSGGKVWGYAIL